MAESGIVWILPGIGGCELWTPPIPIVGSRRIWLDYVNMLAGSWRLLGLLDDGVTSWTPGLGVMEPGPALWDYYGILMGRLSGYGWSVRSARLDWRGTLARDGARVADTIRAHADQGPQYLVCHSRGGLVARAALANLAATGQLGLVSRGVGIAVPHWGSFAAVGLLAGWWETARTLRTFLEVAPRLLVGGVLPDQLYDAIRSWPACYQLLPRGDAPTPGGESPAAVYGPLFWERNGLTIKQQWVDYAGSAWTSLPYTPDEVPWLDVIGDGQMTPVAFANTDIAQSPGSCLWEVAGDGTVPSAWAQQPGKEWARTIADHGSIVHHTATTNWIDAWFRGLPI